MAEIRESMQHFRKNELQRLRRAHCRGETSAHHQDIRAGDSLRLCRGAADCFEQLQLRRWSRQQLAKLEGVETRIRSIIENILDGMITVDEEGVIRSMNPAAEKMFGCINNEMVGHKFTKLVPKSYGTEPAQAGRLRLGRISQANRQHHPRASAARASTQLSRSKFR